MVAGPSKPSYAEQLQKALTQVNDLADIRSHVTIPVLHAGKMDTVQQGIGGKKRTQSRGSSDARDEGSAKRRTNQVLSRGDRAESAVDGGNRTHARQLSLNSMLTHDQAEYEQTLNPYVSGIHSPGKNAASAGAHNGTRSVVASSSYAQLLSASMSESESPFNTLFSVVHDEDDGLYVPSELESGGSAQFGHCGLDVLASVADSELKFGAKRLKGKKKSR